MAVIEWKKDGTVAAIILNNGENRQNLNFALTMQSVLDEIEADENVTSIVITSSDKKNWSQGIDLPWILARRKEKDTESVRKLMYGMNDVFKRILLCPVPVIAAINGHAIGNGGLLALVCDFRIMRVDKGFFSFPEINIDIPFHPGMLAIMRKVIPAYKLEEMVLTGKLYNASELEEHHIIHKTCQNEESLWEEAMGLAASLKKRRTIFGEMKKRLHKEIINIIEIDDPPSIEERLLLREKEFNTNNSFTE